MDAGRLDRFITIQRSEGTQSDSGEMREQWAIVEARRPASYRALHGAERYVGAQIGATEQVEFRIRWSDNVADLRPTDRLIYPALSGGSPDEEPQTRHVYDILAVLEVGRREGFAIVAARRPDVEP